MKNKGFTLIELMIVVAIIAIIAAIAIPNLLRSRLQSNEAAAIGNLKTVVGAQTAYSAAEGGYAGTWDELRPMSATQPNYLDIDLDGVVVQGYNYLLAAAGTAQGNGTTNFTVNADAAEQDVSGVRHFFTDASGVIRFNAAAVATAADLPI